MAAESSLYQVALTAFATFFTTVAPIKVAPVFSALTQGSTPRDRRRTAVKGTVIATIILVIFGIWGDDLLRILGITLSALRVGGGILLLLLAINLVLERSDDVYPSRVRGGASAQDADRIAVFPLAMPLIAGPASITAVVVLISEEPGRVLAQVVILAMLGLVLALTVVTLLLAGMLERVFGETGMNVIGRILGIILAALAAQLILEGVRGSGIFRQ